MSYAAEELSAVIALAEKLKTSLSECADQALVVHERAQTREMIDQMTWKIWGYCRLNKESLDSSRHCKLIRQAIEEAMGEVQHRNDSLVTGYEETKRKYSKERKQRIERSKKLETVNEELKAVKKDLKLTEDWLRHSKAATAKLKKQLAGAKRELKIAELRGEVSENKRKSRIPEAPEHRVQALLEEDTQKLKEACID